MRNFKKCVGKGTVHDQSFMKRINYQFIPKTTENENKELLKNLSYFFNHQTIKKKIKDVWNIALVVLDLLCGFDIRERVRRDSTWMGKILD